jgi:titin
MKKLLLTLAFLIGVTGLAHAQTSSITNEMTWGASPEAVDYLIERKTDAGAFVQIAVVTAPTVTYQDALLAVGPVYTWRVIARNAAGNSAPSPTCSTITMPPSEPLSLSCSVTFNP